MSVGCARWVGDESDLRSYVDADVVEEDVERVAQMR